MSKLIKPVVIFLFFTLLGCGGDESEKKKLANLVVIPEISTDGSGMVSLITSVENAEYFKFYFGDVDNEVPVEQDFGSTNHTYENSGTYTITVQAHRSETDFISESIEITIEVFIPIPATGYTTPTSYAGMSLLWSDEFDGSTVDGTKWKFEIGGGGWGNNELEFYKKENASIVEGNLMIEARADGSSYTSARMITKGKFDFKYGRVDIRAALPKGQGIWPALWMLGSNIDAVNWPACGEIDIMEMIGGTTEREKTTYGTLHWDNSGSHACTCDKPGHVLSTGSLNESFHVFTITWDATFITWYVDDVQFNKIDISPAGLSEFHEKFFFIFNVAVGGNWPGNPNSSTRFPQRMFVDYIRVFQ